jgi:hypothetical protein
MRCEFCGHEQESGDTCESCGLALPGVAKPSAAEAPPSQPAPGVLRCESCGHEQASGKFCDACGLRIDTYQAPVRAVEPSENLRLCPTCGVPVDGLVCRNCGVRVPSSEES